MADDSLFTALHISDFHFSKRKQREQDIIVKALLADLKELCIGHRKPDVIIFTGDLVNAAGADLHDDAYDFLIERVSKATGVSDERIFIAPGNHDLSWPGLEAHASDLKEWRSLLNTADETSKLNELFDGKAFDEAVAAKFANYIELERYISGGDRGGARKVSSSFATVDHVAALNLDIVCFNTAVLSSGGHKSFSGDEHNLAIPEYAIMEAVEALTEGSLRIFATHHPFAWLSEQSAKYMEGEVAKHAHLHLFGHMHDPQPKKIVGLKGEVLCDQAGALFTSRRDYYNGYSLITMDRSNGYTETLVRSYFKDRNQFDDGIDIVEGGRWWSSVDARQHFRKIASPVEEVKFRLHLSGSALSALQEREACVGGDGDIHARFIDPPLRRTFIQNVSDDESKVETETPIPFNDVVEGDANLIIYAKSEYGRTTLLKELRYRTLLKAGDVRFPRLPVLIDFADISGNADNMLRKARAGAEQTPDGHDLESLLKLGHVVMLIDDVHFGDPRRMKILRDFVSRFPKTRYIFSSPHSTATKLGAAIDPEMPVRFEFVEIRELRRNDMRLLLAKDERCKHVEMWLDRLQAEFREINLPFTAANGSILIEILSEKYNFNPINRAVLMEQFVDSTLRKAAIEQSRRETFDYTNKTDLLSHIASWMAKSEQYIPTREDLRSEMKSYIDNRGLNVSLDDLLSEFFGARIFINRAEGRISFRYRGVLEYFIALRMTVDASFKDWVMAEERYLRYVNEIQYYAGKLRNDAVLVDLVAARHEKILEDALQEMGDVDPAVLETLQLPQDGAAEAANAIDVDLASPPLSKEEKDAELEAEFPTDEEDRQEVFRPNVTVASDKVTLSVMLYSGLIKNMELIPDADKRRHLSKIWRGWAILLVGALRFAPRLAKERRLRINGAMYEVQAPFGMSDITLLKKMMVALPHIHIRLLSNALGTEKLERQLTEPQLPDHPEPKIYEFLRTGLIADLGLPATPMAISNLAQSLRDNKYLLWSLIVHIGELRRMDRVQEGHFKALEEPLAGAIANLRGGSHKVRADVKRKELARLGRDRLMLTMKREREK
ncbi:metallophosphoesterase [Novosphingobium lindaniclasticum]|jgi:predicted MPP superfamily phosphohydrolase|uniref:metallophosphoesterase n=1 Tax=Novosphingobium lindaniclasticum TaxID=1329895 RepID=UPI0024094503|nr:metallophosphoesterase [Novosphingobium lindaniclasticum]